MMMVSRLLACLRRRALLGSTALFFTWVPSLPGVDLERAHSTLIPKREIRASAFLEANPTFDGRDVVIAVFDTGVDPAALGLQVTTTGERKIVDVIDGSGAGDVDMRQEVELSEITADAPLFGLTGRELHLPESLDAPSGTIRVGMKRGRELFHSEPWDRLIEDRRETWKLQNDLVRAERKRQETDEDRTWEDKHPDDRSLAERDVAARENALEALEDNYLQDDPGPVYDCVLWHDGEVFRVVVDTDEDGDLRDETVLSPFGPSGDYARFADPISATFAVQVYEEGDLLSIVTVSGSHGTHVAAIAAAHFPDEPERNGIAPGTRILSVRMGDVRMFGSSNYFGEIRATASAAQYGVDIMNASWGGDSAYQDGSNLGSDLYNKLVRDYGVTAFVSAGNSGPALSTLGSPGGEAIHVIGVGAYVSPEMGKYLYALQEENPSTAFGFTSRGPARSGDLGVDIFAPGAATATLASDSLRGSQRYNGTSMAAPSAAGAGALLLSAAKQLGLETTPERIKAAFMNTARSVYRDPFAEGAGLIQVGPALDFLRETAAEPAWDLHYELQGPDGTFRSGPGLYLRETLTDSRIEVPITVRPHFAESSDHSTAYQWEADALLRTSADWLQAPQYVRLANGNERLTLTIDATKLPPAGVPAYAELTAHLAGDPERGPLFRFPVTIIQPEPLSHPVENRHEGIYPLKAGETQRIFLQAPKRADRMALTVKLPDDGTLVQRLFVTNVLSLASDATFEEANLTRYERLQPGQEKTFWANVHPGQVVEITLNQYWSSPGAYEIELEAQFEGVDASEQTLVVGRNYDFTGLRLQPLKAFRGSVEANLEQAVWSRFPNQTERFPGDPRMTFPPAPGEETPYTPVRLRQTFEIELEEATTVTLAQGRPFDVFQEYGGDFYTLYDAQGRLLHAGASWNMEPTALSKGTHTITRDIITFDEALLDAAEDRPLVLFFEAKVGSLEVYPDATAIARGQSSGTLHSRAGRHHTLYLKNTAAEAIAEFKPKPDFLLGTVKVTNDDDQTMAAVEFLVQPGDTFSKVANPEPEPEKNTETEGPVALFEETLFDQQVAFAKEQLSATDPEIAEARDDLVDSLIEEHPEEASLYLLRAQITAVHARLVPAYLGTPAPAEVEKAESDGESDESNPAPDLSKMDAVLRDLAEARELSDPEEVAQFFGAQPTNFPGDTETRFEQEEVAESMNEARRLLADTWRWEAALAVQNEDSEAFRDAYLQLSTWETEPSEETRKLLGAYYETEGFWGLKLQQVNESLQEAPADTALFEERIAIYRKLGWDDFAQRDALILQLRKAAPLNLL